MRTVILSWKTRKLAFISLSLCFLESAVFTGVIGALALTGEPLSQSLVVRKIVGIAWIACGPTSVAFACAALFLDTHRGFAAIALVVAVAIWVLCSLQVLV